MSKLLFRMRHVPEDEARDVRDLLQKNNIEFFETFSGNWSISIPAIWVSRDDQYTEARKIIDLYQAERADEAKKRILDQEIKGVKLRLEENLAPRAMGPSGIGGVLSCIIEDRQSTGMQMALIRSWLASCIRTANWPDPAGFSWPSWPDPC